MLPLLGAACGGAGEPAAVATSPSPQPTLPAPAAATPATFAAAPKAKTPAAATADDAPVLYPEMMSALEQTSPWDLPPEMHLVAGTTQAVDEAILRKRVLESSSLALSPQARKNVESGRVAPEALAVLDALPDGASPFLVFGAKGTKLRVQATNLRETVGAIDGFQGLAHDGILAGLRLVPVADNTYDEGKDYAKGERRGAIGEKAVQLALKYLGVPYVWGGATPEGGFDCSGLVMYVYGKLGVRLHHFTGLQWLEGTRIDAAMLKPGDMVFFHPQAGHPGHEGMYIGGGKFIHAPHTGDVVKISDLAGYSGNYVGAVRPY